MISALSANLTPASILSNCRICLKFCHDVFEESLGGSVFARAPLRFPELMASALKRRDIWARAAEQQQLILASVPAWHDQAERVGAIKQKTRALLPS